MGFLQVLEPDLAIPCWRPQGDRATMLLGSFMTPSGLPPADHLRLTSAMKEARKEASLLPGKKTERTLIELCAAVWVRKMSARVCYSSSTKEMTDGEYEASHATYSRWKEEAIVHGYGD